MLPPKQFSILQALGKYKFLTRLQMARIGIDKYNSTLSRSCKPLVVARYIGLQDATAYGLGHVYYLTKKGKILLHNSAGSSASIIQYCSSKPKLTSQTLWHRTHAISCQIELEIASKKYGIPILLYDRDIDISHGHHLSRKTRLSLANGEFLEPDAVFKIQTPKSQRLFCFEYEHKDYTKKSIEKVIKHIHALNEKSPSRKYNHDKAHKVLFVYNNRSTMESVMRFLREKVKDAHHWFLFKTLENLISEYRFQNSIFMISKEKNYFDSWLNCSNIFTSI